MESQNIGAMSSSSSSELTPIQHRVEPPPLPAMRCIPRVSCVPAEMDLTAVKTLMATNLIPRSRNDSPDRAKTITNINDSFKWTTARIGSLFKAIANHCIVTEQDAAHIEKLHHDLQEITDQLSEDDKKSATEQIQKAYSELERLDILHQELPHYRKDEEHLEEVLEGVTSHENGPLCSFDAAAQSLQLLAALSSQVDKTHPLHPFLLHTTTWFSETLDEWSDDLRRRASQELEYLTSVLKADPHNQAALKLLGSLENRLLIGQDRLKALAKTAKAQGLPDVAKSLKQAGRELGRLSRPSSRAVGLPPVYGSEAWKQLMESCPKPERSLVGSLLHPEEWSKRTKDRVVRGMALFQLAQQGIGIYQHIERSTYKETALIAREAGGPLTKEIKDRIDDEASTLTIFLTDRYDVLSSPGNLERLTKKHPNIRPVLEEIMERYGTHQPTAEEISAITQTYTKWQQHVQAVPNSGLTFADWWQASTISEREINPTTAETLTPTTTTSIAAIGPLQRVRHFFGLFRSSAAAPSYHAFVNDTCAAKQAEVAPIVQKARTIHDQLATASAPDLEPLREMVTLSLGALLRSSREMSRGNLSLTELADLMQQVDDQCFAIEELEKWIFESMAPLRQATMGDKGQLLEGGTKHAHLVLMDRAYGAVPIPGAYVPRKSLVKGNDVLELLKVRSPQVDTYREQLAERFSRHTGDAATFLDDPEVLAILQAIDTAMAEAFEHDDAVDLIDSYPELRELIADVARKKGHLITRSTALDEDTAEVTNAGGNESVPYVEPTAKEVAKAVGEVARSYYSPNSLRIRLNAGQKPFNTKPSFPVIVMEHVGEPIGGAQNPADIPVGVVDFTNRQDYTGGGFRLETASATFGQGSSIVKRTTGVNVDRALMWPSRAHPDRLNILYTNVDKPARLGPVKQTPEGGVVFGLLDNPPELRRSPALSDEMLHRFYHSAIFDEAYFGDVSTDRESAVIGGRKARLQARAYDKETAEQYTTTATYLDILKIAQEKNSPITETVQGELLVNEKASFLPVTNREQVLVARTLDEAEQKFVKGHHELVVVQKDEPDTSHAYVNFKQQRIPCLIVKDAEAIDDLLSKVDNSHPLAVCTQTAALHLWDITKADMQQFVTNGYAVHPARVVPCIPTTIEGPSTAPSREIPQDVKDLLIAVRAAGTREEALHNLEKLHAHPWLVHVVERGAFARQQLASETPFPAEISERYKTIVAFCETLEWHREEFEAALKDPAANRLEQLLNHKVIEALLVGRANKGATIGQFSVVDILAIDKDIDQLLAYQKGLSHSPHLMDLVLDGNTVITSEGTRQWTEVLKSLEPLINNGSISKEKVAQFKAFITTLQKANVMAPWLTIYFPNVLQAAKGAPPSSALLDSLIQTLPANEGPFVTQHLQIQREVQELKNQVESFADPKSFSQAWQTLQRLTSPGVQRRLLEELQRHSPVAQMIALSTMKQTVDLFDAALKSILAPNNWEDEEKIPVFKQMLYPFHGLLEQWIKDAVRAGSISMYRNRPLTSYLSWLKRKLDDAPNQGADQLLPGKADYTGSQFSVIPVTLGSGADFAHSQQPSTLVDVFTTIHQSTLVAIGRIGNDLLSAELLQGAELPDSFRTGMTRVTSVLPNRVALDITEDHVTAKFNVPLRQHSSALALTYDKQSGGLAMDVQYMGADENFRWRKVALIVESLSKVGILPLANINRESTAVSICWKISNQEQLLFALEQFRDLGEASTDGNYPLYFQQLANLVQDGHMSLLFSQMIRTMLFNRFSMSPWQLSNYRDSWRWTLRYLSADKELLAIAEEAISNPDPEVRAETIRWIAISLGKHAGGERHLAIARAGLADPDPLVSGEASKLYAPLLKDGLIPVEEALAFAKMGIGDPRYEGASFEIYDALADRDTVYSEVLAAARSLIAWRGQWGTELFRKLIEKQQGHRELAEVVVLKSSSYQRDLQELLNKAIARGEGLREAAEVAVAAFSNPDRQAEALVIAKAIFRSGKASPDVMELLASGAASEKSDVSDFALDVAKDQLLSAATFGTACTIYQRILSTELPQYVQERVLRDIADFYDSASGVSNVPGPHLEAFDALVINAIQRMVDAAEKPLQPSLHRILRVLVERGKAFELAQQVVAKATLSSDQVSQYNVLQLLKALLPQGQGLGEAMNFISVALKDVRTDLNEEALLLAEMIARQEKGNAQLIQAVQDHLKLEGLDQDRIYPRAIAALSALDHTQEAVESVIQLVAHHPRSEISAALAEVLSNDGKLLDAVADTALSILIKRLDAWRDARTAKDRAAAQALLDFYESRE